MKRNQQKSPTPPAKLSNSKKTVKQQVSWRGTHTKRNTTHNLELVKWIQNTNAFKTSPQYPNQKGESNEGRSHPRDLDLDETFTNPINA